MRGTLELLSLGFMEGDTKVCEVRLIPGICVFLAESGN